MENADPDAKARLADPFLANLIQRRITPLTGRIN
jgi:hypothetical protein